MQKLLCVCVCLIELIALKRRKKKCLLRGGGGGGGGGERERKGNIFLCL